MHSYRESEEGDMIENDVSKDEADLESYLLAWEALGFDKSFFENKQHPSNPQKLPNFIP